MIEFKIYNHQGFWTIQSLDNSWVYSSYFTLHSKREIIRKLKQKAYDKFKVKRIKTTIYEDGDEPIF